MEVMFYFDALKKGWWFVLFLILLSVSVVMAFDYIVPPTYEVSARFIVYPNMDATETGNELINSLDQLSDRSVLATYSEVIDSEYIKQQVCQQIGITIQTYDKIFEQTTVVLPDANIFETVLRGYDPILVADVLNLTGDLSVNYINNLYEIFLVSFLDIAQVPAKPVRPQPLRDAILAVMVGGILGILLVIGREQILMPIEELRERRNIDPTSQAYRKSYIENVILDAIQQQKEKEFVFTVAMIRLEGLLDWFDLIPQGTADQVIQDLSEKITNLLKGCDIVGRWDRISFMLYLPRTTETDAERLIKNIAIVLQEPIHISYLNEDINPKPITIAKQYKLGDSYNETIKHVSMIE